MGAKGKPDNKVAHQIYLPEQLGFVDMPAVRPDIGTDAQARPKSVRTTHVSAEEIQKMAKNKSKHLPAEPGTAVGQD